MANRLTILLTNIWLEDFGGSEVVVRDMAVGLLRRGHRPIVYSPKLGRAAEEIISRGVPVTDDLRTLAETPDIIHAHHCIPCGEALIRFPHVPAIFVCHGFESWLEAPAHFPQIGVYVAVDEACRDRLVQREGIAPERVVTLYNGVDMARIPPRPRPLNRRPERAIAFAKASGLPELRTACEQMGISYHALGMASGNTTAYPEKELVNCDLVFTSARAALESLCCGCAVIVCDNRGLAGLVTSHNFESLRSRNFGIRTLSEIVTVGRCVEEIARYDAADAALVAERARRECNLEGLLDSFEKLYDEVLTGPRRPTLDPRAHDLAAARFLHEYLPRHPSDSHWPWRSERKYLYEQIEALQTELAMIRRSRMLHLGRLFKRIIRRPSPY